MVLGSWEQPANNAGDNSPGIFRFIISHWAGLVQPIAKIKAWNLAASSSFVAFFFDFFISIFFCFLCEMSSHGANTSAEVQQKRSKQPETATNDSRNNKLNFTFSLTLIKFLGWSLSAMHSLLLLLLLKRLLRFFYSLKVVAFACSFEWSATFWKLHSQKKYCFIGSAWIEIRILKQFT